MTDKPVTVLHDTDPGTPEDTVVVTRFNRKKIAKIAGAALAAAGAVLVIFGAGKAAGVNDALDKLSSDDADDETTES